MESYQQILDDTEKQLKEMAIKLSDHLKLISRLKIEQEFLINENQELAYKLKKKEDHLNQEFKDTSILLNKIDLLEKGPRHQTGLLSKLFCFFAKQRPDEFTNKPEVKDAYSSDNEVQEMLEPELMYAKEAKKIEEVDIELELERMGISQIVKKI